MRRWTIALVALISMTLSCERKESLSPQQREPKTIRIVLSTKGPGEGNPFWADLQNGARDAATKLGVELTVIAPPIENDTATQISQLEDQIARRVSAIVVAPADVAALMPTFDRARAHGIPVVIVDSDTPWPHKVSFIGTDNVVGGRLAGKYLCGQLAKGEGVALITGVMTQQSHIDRVKGVHEALGTCGLSVIAEQPGNSERVAGQDAAENILTAKPHVSGIFATNDLMALGTLEALRARKKLGTVKVVGFDGIPEALQSVQHGELSATIAQHPSEMGRLGVESAVKALHGETVPKRIDTGTSIVTATK